MKSKLANIAPILAGIGATVAGMLLLSYFNAEEWEVVLLSLGLGVMAYKITAGIKL